MANLTVSKEWEQLANMNTREKLEALLTLQNNVEFKELMEILKQQQALCNAAVLEGCADIREEDRMRGQWHGLGAADATLRAMVEELQAAVSVDNNSKE